MIKTLSRMGIERSYLNTIKTIHEKILQLTSYPMGKQKLASLLYYNTLVNTVHFLLKVLKTCVFTILALTGFTRFIKSFNLFWSIFSLLMQDFKSIFPTGLWVLNGLVYAQKLRVEHVA